MTATEKAVAMHPATYANLKKLARSIIVQPLDIKAYLPTVQKLADMLALIDPNETGETGSIFHLFKKRFMPCSIWQVPLLRVECTDLLAYLDEFEQWRRRTRRLRLIK